jgi:hypothetical protein
MDPDPRQPWCHAIETTCSMGQATIRSHRHPSCPNAKNHAVHRPLTPRVLATRSRTAVGHGPARQVGSLRGGIALRHRIPRGPRNGPPDPSATRPTRPHTSHGPSCPWMHRDATTAQGGVPPPSCGRSPSTGWSPCPRDALCPVWYAVLRRRGQNAGLAPQDASDRACQTGLSRKRGQRCTWAAPHPRLHPPWRTCHVYPPLDADGTRAPRCVEGAATSRMGCCTRQRQGERTSRSVWCSHVGAPAGAITSEHVADGPRCWHQPGGKQCKKPLRGSLCPLTTGGLIRVGRRLPESWSLGLQRGGDELLYRL